MNIWKVFCGSVWVLKACAISSRVGLVLRIFAFTCHQKVYGTPACFGFCCLCWHDLVCCDLFWYCGPKLFANQPWEPVSSIQGCDPARKPVTGQVNSVVNHLKERWEIAHISLHILDGTYLGDFHTWKVDSPKNWLYHSCFSHFYAGCLQEHSRGMRWKRAQFERFTDNRMPVEPVRWSFRLDFFSWSGNCHFYGNIYH